MKNIKEILKKNSKKIIIYLSVLIILGISMCFSSFIDKCIINVLTNKNHVIANNKLIIHFMDVGQADAVAINLPNGEIAIIDTGSEYSANDLIMYLDTYVMSLGKEKIDYLFFSHADSDHTGGIKSIVYNYEVKNIIRPRQYASFENLTSDYDAYFEDESGSFDSTMLAIYEEVDKGAKLIKAEDMLHFDLGGVNVDIFYPNIKAEDSNSFSYFIKVEYKGKSLLFTGDVDEEMEKAVLKTHENEINCDILKVAHHGSSTSSSDMFVYFASPKYAVISVGNNYYGHPSYKVVDRLTGYGAEVLRTDLEGNIVFSIEDDIDVYLGLIYISKIEFSYFQLCWCVIFIIICYVCFWILKKLKMLAK